MGAVMAETVSEIIAARSREPAGLPAIVGLSMLAHVCVGIFVTVAIADWMSRPSEAPPTVMTISLGGSPGPRTGGLTSIGGRTVQAPAPEPPRLETTAAAKEPAVVQPSRSARTRPPVAQATRDSTGTTPTTGAVPSQGPARAETQTRGQGFGLTTGGGAGSGVQLDVGNFCCPEYLELMVRTIRQGWESNQGVAGSIVMRFTITRLGTIEPESIQLERASGFAAHDLAARRALLLARLPPLPAPYPNPTLGIHMTFEYSR